MNNAYIVQESTLTNIGDAIREKTGNNNLIRLLDMESEIRNIKTSSPNGTEWTNSNITKGTFTIAYGNGLWIACGRGNDAMMYYSEDGKNWKTCTVESDRYYCAKYANGLWVVGGWNYMFYSEDGKTWTKSTTTGTVYDIAYANGIFVAASMGSEMSTISRSGLWYSTDGKTWTQSNVTNKQAEIVYYVNGLWVAGVKDGIYSSIDGMTWIQNLTTSTSVQTITYANGLWVAGSSDGAYYSTDGLTWTLSESSPKGTSISFIEYNDNIWVLGAYLYEGVYYSLDGKNWTKSASISKVRDGYYACGVWVVCGSSGLYYSFDGITWNMALLGRSNNWRVHNERGIWVASSEKGLQYSVTWEPPV